MQRFTGMQYLKIDISSSFGNDRLTWDQRLQWFDQHEHLLEGLIKQAKEPAQFFAGIQAYRATKLQQPSGYLCGLDATASGLQLLSLLAGCEQSAVLCNLVNTNNREDAYTTVHNVLCQTMGTHFPVSRKDSKQALMTHLYGSKAVPQQVFGKDSLALAAFYETVNTLLPGANALNHALLTLWNPTAYAHSWTLPDGFDVVVKVMDTIEHHVTFADMPVTVVEKVNQPTETGLSIGANIVHSIDALVVREMGRRCNFNAPHVAAVEELLRNPSSFGGSSSLRNKDLALLRALALYETSGFLSAVIFEYLDEDNMGHLDSTARKAALDLIDSLPIRSFPLLCIHDCFKFHPNYGNDVRQQYINILAELADSDIMSDIASQVTGNHVPVNKLSNTLSQHIRNSEYAIC